MDRPPYASVVRLYGQAAQDWIWLVAEHPGLDLLRLPPERLLTLVYARTLKVWVQSDEVRMKQPMDMLITQFDQMLSVPVPGQLSRPGADQNFIGDYKALQGMGD